MSVHPDRHVTEHGRQPFPARGRPPPVDHVKQLWTAARHLLTRQQILDDEMSRFVRQAYPTLRRVVSRVHEDQADAAECHQTGSQPSIPPPSNTEINPMTSKPFRDRLERQPRQL